jgi:hypothetical protein
MPAAAPLLLGLNSAAVYRRIDVGPHRWRRPHVVRPPCLGLVGAAFIVAALLAECAHGRIAQADRDLVLRRRTASAVAGNPQKI